MKEYEEPVVNVIALGADIITSSGGNDIETSQSENLLGSNGSSKGGGPIKDE